MEHDAAIRVRQALQDSIALLASPAEAQVAWLSELGVAPLADELILEFDELSQLLPQLESADVVGGEAAAAIAALSRAVDAIPEGDEGWRDVALASDPRWTTIRRMAGLALVSMLVGSREQSADFVRVG